MNTECIMLPSGLQSQHFGPLPAGLYIGRDMDGGSGGWVERIGKTVAINEIPPIAD